MRDQLFCHTPIEHSTSSVDGGVTGSMRTSKVLSLNAFLKAFLISKSL